MDQYLPDPSISAMTPASPLDDRIEANSRCKKQVDGLVTPKYWNQARITSITSTDVS